MTESEDGAYGRIGDSSLEGERLFLRPVGEDDLLRLVEWRNAPEARSQFFNREPLRPEGQSAWLAGLRDDPARAVWIIRRRDDDAPVGTIGLSGIDPENRSAEFGNMLIGDPRARGKGMALEASALLLAACFRDWSLRRVFLHVFADNEPAVGLYRRLGFREEGRLREAWFADGACRDVLVMALLASEFEHERLSRS